MGMIIVNNDIMGTVHKDRNVLIGDSPLRQMRLAIGRERDAGPVCRVSSLTGQRVRSLPRCSVLHGVSSLARHPLAGADIQNEKGITKLQHTKMIYFSPAPETPMPT